MNEECVVCAKELSEGIFMASTIVSPVNGKIPIRILNTTEKTVTLTEIKPNIHKLSEYNLCSFDSCTQGADRVKTLLSNLNLKHLNLEEKIAVQNVCAKYADIFYLPGDTLKTTPIYNHKIHLKEHASPIYMKPYRLPHSQKPEIEKQIKNMLSQNIIEPCSSEWSSPVLLVPKKIDTTGQKKFRLVIDYRKLNNAIKDDKFPLPNITDILDSLSGCIYFTHLDLYQGFYNVKLDKHSRKYTAFCSGQYQMTRMPMGLKTSPNSFSRMMNMAMAGLTYEKCLVYLDDVVVYGKCLNSATKNLIDVFDRLRKTNLKLNPIKCDFLRKEMLYLGHVISSDGVQPDPEKLNVVKNYPVPKNSDEVKRFVAFANYYRKFINKFAAIAQPLNNLSKKNTKFQWTDDCQQSFDLLKQLLMNPPILQYPNFSSDNVFTLQTDASGYAIGAVLANQNGKPVAYASRTLNKAEKMYPTIEKELLAIVWAVKHFRPYLYGRKFKVLTDHKPLIYLFNIKDPSSRLMKFRILLEDYDFYVEYVKGSDNAAADALSRITITSKDLKEMHECVLNVLTRAQKKKLCTGQDNSDTMVTTDGWTDQPNVVETHSKPKMSIELTLTCNKTINKLRKENVIVEESQLFVYVPKNMVIYIKPEPQSQSTPGAFVRELETFCGKLKIDEIYFLKNKQNSMFIKLIAQEIKQSSPWLGPRLCILDDVIRIQDKDEIRVILNDFHLLPTSGHAGIRRMVNNIKK